MLPRHWLVAAALALVLSGCSGGSGPAVNPPSDPAPPDDTVENILNLRMTVATTPFLTSFGGDVAVCQALGCPVIDGIHVDPPMDDLMRLPDLSAFERLEPQRGVDRATRSHREERLKAPVSYRAFGAWTDRGFFIVETSLSEESREFTYRTWWFGNASDTGPVTGAGGSAHWSGIMTGVTDGSSGDRGTFIQGDADLTVTGLRTPGAASVDVEFTNIAREDNGAALGIQAEGSLFGHIYGPNGEEVGGLFHRNSIAGAFAAKRDE